MGEGCCEPRLANPPLARSDGDDVPTLGSWELYNFSSGVCGHDAALSIVRSARLKAVSFSKRASETGFSEDRPFAMNGVALASVIGMQPAIAAVMIPP
jgi:hypothetical protein